MRSRWKEPDDDAVQRRVIFPFPGVEECTIREWPKEIVLSRIRIDPLFQGQGIGSRVLAELKKMRKTIHLVVYPDNPNLCEELARFYRRNGFTEVEGENALWIWKP